MENVLIFKSNGDGTCKLVVTEKYEEEHLEIPDFSPDGDAVVSVRLNLPSSPGIKSICLPSHIDVSTARLYGYPESLEQLDVSSANPNMIAYDGILYSKDMTELIRCPIGRKGTVIIPEGVHIVSDGAFSLCERLEAVVFQEGLLRIEDEAFFGCGMIVTVPDSVSYIHPDAGICEYSDPLIIIRASRHSYARRFAEKNGYKYMPSDCPVVWDAEAWKKEFERSYPDYHSLRKKVWKNTLEIVSDGGYTLSDGTSVMLPEKGTLNNEPVFYRDSFTPVFLPLPHPPQITVVSDDCLDVAHKWKEEDTDVCVLNMASRRNPGGGVRNGAGAQEEYLFRCSDYYLSLYRFTDYAGEYNITPSSDRYPLDRDFGGIYSPNVTVFRGNEESGYALLKKPWQVNMIAVAGMNSPRLIRVKGEERIDPVLVNGVKNKIRTIFRIACHNGQRNLVLGALGCGAFRNPPKHVAELFREVLCEPEFVGAFNKICFAVKSDHNSRGSKNYEAFREILDGFVAKNDSNDRIEPSTDHIPIKKIAVSRDSFAILYSDRDTVEYEFYKYKKKKLKHLYMTTDIAAGFDYYVGLSTYGNIHTDGKCKNDSFANNSYHFSNWHEGAAVYACEGHFAMLMKNGKARCADGHHYEIPPYRGTVEAWSDMKQLALTFEMPFGLTSQGKFYSEEEYLNDYFNSRSEAEIVQIAAFGCYYSTHVVAALYADKTVRARIIWNNEIEEVKEWQNVKKIGCGISGAVGALTYDNRLLINCSRPFFNDRDEEVKELKDIYDFEMGFLHIVALTRSGRIVILQHK